MVVAARQLPESFPRTIVDAKQSASIVNGKIILPNPQRIFT